MVPSVFVRLDALPAAADGKVDRRALPRAGRAASRRRPPTVAPRSATRAQTHRGHLASRCSTSTTWGVDDNFFDLGGQSLLIVQVQITAAAKPCNAN